MTSHDIGRQDIHAEAAAWLARLRADDLTEADRSAFRTWLSENIDHAQAFDAVNSVWDSIGAMPRDLRGGGAAKIAGAGTGRRKVLAGLCVLLLAGGGVGYWQSAQATVYETDVGEQRHIILDGCQVFLDTDTRLIVRGSTQSTTVERGCANFRVMRDAGRPIVVNVGQQTITATRANMDVRREDAEISVFVIEGEAILTGHLDYGVRRLDAGERFISGEGQQPKLDRPDIAILLAWHNGQAIFRNDRLVDVAKEMNRYSVIKLIVADPAAANARISGVYSVGDNLAFANSISKLLPVNVVFSGGSIEISESGAR